MIGDKERGVFITIGIFEKVWIRRSKVQSFIDMVENKDDSKGEIIIYSSIFLG